MAHLSFKSACKSTALLFFVIFQRLNAQSFGTGLNDSLVVTEISTSFVHLKLDELFGVGSVFNIQWTGDPTSGNMTFTNRLLNITDLTAGVNYTFCVTDEAENSTVCISACTKPDVIRNLTVANITTSSAFLKWDEPQGNRSFFKIQWSDNNSVNNITTNDTWYNITDLTAGVSYTFNITAVATDKSTQGEPVVAIKYTKPGVIMNLKADNITTSSVLLSWTKPNGQSSYYNIEYGNNNVTTENTSMEIHFLVPGAKYTFRVFAVAADRVTEGDSNQILLFAKPDVVRNLSVVNITTSSAFLKWDEPQGNRSYFKIQWSDNNSVNYTETNDTWYNITDLTAGVSYTFNITAVATDKSTEGEPVVTTKYTKPGVIMNLKADNITTSSVLLSWTKPNGQSSYYKIEYGNNNVTTENTSMEIHFLVPGAKYTFKVFAVAADRVTEGDSNQISLFAKPVGTSSLVVTNITTSSVVLTWNEPNGNRSFYKIDWTADKTNKSGTEMTTSDYLQITNLTAGVSYTFCITADNSNGSAAFCISQFTKPDVVRNLIVANITTSSAFLKWDEPQGNRSFFKIQWSDNNSVNNTATNDTWYNITDLTAGVSYTFIITAVATDKSTEGEPVATTKYTKPGVIMNLKADNITTSSVLLSWTKPNGQSSYYNIEYGNNNVTTENTSMEIYFLVPGAKYTFKVFAVAADRVTEGDSNQISLFAKPDVVRNLSVVNITTSSAFLKWDEPQGNRSYFKIQWSDNNSVNYTETNDTWYNITDLTAGVSYTFNITAVATDKSTEGEPVVATKYTKPGVIMNLKADNITTSSVLLSWTKPNGQSSYYKIEYGNNNVTTENTSMEIYFLVPGAQYTFKVFAVAADRVTEGDSNQISLFAKPDVIRNFTASQITTSFVFLTWQPTGNISFFKLQWTDDKTNQNATETNNTFYNITDLTAGVNYTFCITAVAAEQSNEGAAFCISQFTQPNMVSSLTVSSVTSSSVSLKWDAPSGRIDFYIVQWTNQRKSITTKNTFYDITGLMAGTNYTVCVSAVTGNTSQSQLFCLPICTNTSVHSSVTNKPVGSSPQTNPNTGLIVGILLLLIVFAMIFGITSMVFFYSRREVVKHCQDIPVHTITNIALRIEEYEEYFKQKCADSNHGFAIEYEELRFVGTAQANTAALALENKEKNRYLNVLPYDASRVKLLKCENPFDDYINANYVPGYNSRKEFIAAQGPLPVTINKFWRMIWENKVYTIVMLTKCNELGKVKCEKYWPSETDFYHNISVTTTSETELDDWTIRDFSIKNVETEETCNVRQFHFTAWPDHGVPETTEVLIEFRHLVREHMNQYSCTSPTVVHCSAGVGRTGTFIAIDHLISQIERDSMVDIYGIVHDMRMHRALMVQTEDQYVYLYQCAYDLIQSRTMSNNLIYQNTASFEIYQNVDFKENKDKMSFTEGSNL
ncbi:receptor-type tyrosine-protein phosphatase eta-like isoform X2 [Danio rerio]|uniref:Receptor-type tyrosine-protein phosphatase eta-like isoform X2 n=1 Tax=Danio rerio TaxID=7955 RepID=A0AB32THN3_DANRE